MWNGGEWNIEFRRSFEEEELREWQSLIQDLNHLQLDEGKDGISWKLEKAGTYTTKSMYRLLSFGGINNKRLQKIDFRRVKL